MSQEAHVGPLAFARLGDIIRCLHAGSALQSCLRGLAGSNRTLDRDITNTQSETNTSMCFMTQPGVLHQFHTLRFCTLDYSQNNPYKWSSHVHANLPEHAAYEVQPQPGILVLHS